MPRKKISIEEAFEVLQQAGINVQVKPPVEEPPSVNEAVAAGKRKGQIFPSPIQQVSHKSVKITLFARHSIGSGGVLTGKGEEKQIEHAGVQTYGPGVCTVPVEYAGYLLSQDQKAKQADERMLDRTQHSYMIVRKMNNQGNVVDVGVQVPSEMFDDIGNLPSDYLYRIR